MAAMDIVLGEDKSETLKCSDPIETLNPSKLSPDSPLYRLVPRSLVPWRNHVRVLCNCLALPPLLHPHSRHQRTSPEITPSPNTL